MPTYEYVCSKCGHEFEKNQPMADKALTTCLKEICPQKKWGRGPVKRKMSGGAGLIFKGSGFYITDYRSDKYKEAAKKESSAAAPASTGESKAAPASTGETKSAPAKTEAKPAKTKSDKT